MPLRFAVFVVALGFSAAVAAESATPAAEETEKKPSMSERVKARMVQDAKKAPPPKDDKSAAEKSAKAGATPSTPAPTSDQKSATPPPAAKPPEPATVLPKVEVRRERITVLDQQIVEQEREIAREKKNTKPTEVDTALNDPKASKLLSIFGGESSAYRAGIAKERVSLMEAERDILEAMKSAKTKAEKAELQKQLDELRTMRRELEKSAR